MTNNEYGVSNWKAFSKGCMAGTFSLHTPSGLVIHDIALFQKDTRRWLGMPRQRYMNKEGQESFKLLIEFRYRKSTDAFRDVALRALDEALKRKAA
jgi:DNA-binding cell septation regulator SpoVG